MRREAASRTSLVALSAMVAAVGLWTLSFRKTVATYAFGVLGIAGVLLPDWEFFDRDFSQWLTPMPARRPAPGAAVGTDSDAQVRFTFYPLRVALMTTMYALGLYKW